MLWTWEFIIFIITDDLKVEVRSTDLVLKKLKSQSCCDVSKVVEKLVDIGLEEVFYSVLHFFFV